MPFLKANQQPAFYTYVNGQVCEMTEILPARCVCTSVRFLCLCPSACLACLHVSRPPCLIAFVYLLLLASLWVLPVSLSLVFLSPQSVSQAVCLSVCLLVCCTDLTDNIRGEKNLEGSSTSLLRFNAFVSFYDTQAEMMVDSMLKDVRVNAGLGNPPVPFYTNVPESANALIKRAVQFERSEMSDFCTKLANLIKQQREDVRASILNRGPYSLSAKHSHIEVRQDKWFSMAAKQRETHFKKFDDACSKVPEAELATLGEDAESSDLSITPEEAGITTVPLPTIRAIFEKAKVLLGKETSIVLAPGSDGNSYMVESHTSRRPHFVKVEKATGKVVCDECPGWSSSKFCAHAVAVAEKNSSLQAYVRWVERRAGPMNLTSLVTFDTPKGVGRKGSRATSRRRGGRSKRLPDVTQVVDRVNSEPLPHGTASGFAQPTLDPTNANVAPIQGAEAPDARPNIGYPHPLFGTYMLYFLQFCPPQVRQCFGCGQVLKPGGKILPPPHDLVIVSNASRAYTDQSGAVKEKRGNVYYHVQGQCLRRHQAYFIASLVQIPEAIKCFLAPPHAALLRDFGITL